MSATPLRPASAIIGAILAVPLALAGCSGPPHAGPPPIPEGPWRVVEVADGRFGRVEVLEHLGSLALAVDGVFQTVVPAGGLAKGDLLRGGDHAELIPWIRPATRMALLIGLGGGLHARALGLHGIDVVAVDIDPDIVRLARKHFGFAGEAAVADGREMLEADSRRFDAVIVDAFAGACLPERLFTREAFEAAARRLAPGGILAVHLFGRPGHPAVQAVARTAGAVFPRVAATRAGRRDELQAIWLFAGDSPLDPGPWVRDELERLGFKGEFIAIEPGDAPVLTDQGPGLAALAADIAEEHRRMSLEFRRNPPW